MGPDVVLESDTLYDIRSLGPFVSTLNERATADTQIYLAIRHRVPDAHDLQPKLLCAAFEMKVRFALLFIVYWLW